MKKLNAFVLALALISSCNTKETEEPQTAIYPAADGFNLAGSDSLALTIADSVMLAMGGKGSYDELHYLKWNFFGARDLIWDKYSGNVRIDFPTDSSVYLINILDDTGKVWRKGEEMTDPDSLKKYISRGKSIWINDAYWLVMPFKLKDSGVTLKYLREDTTLKGANSQVLELTFNEVGDTPDNKYEVFVDKSDNLIKQWSYFRVYTQDSASAVWPWDNYESYDGVLLSADRSDNRGPRDLVVYDSLPGTVFTEFEVPELE